jgi:vacuolar protein sorting-associated protein 13A/C
MVARIKGTELETLPFDITEAHTTLLQLHHDYAGINAECTPVEGAIKIVFQHYAPGFAAVLLVNQTSKVTIDYSQKDANVERLKLEPGYSTMYTWQDPTGKRELIWSYEGKDFKDELIKDGIGEIALTTDSRLYWVSFLSGTQRVLLFTEDLVVATDAQQAGELERVEQEINVSLQGLGISLINNIQHKEIAYMAVSSSGVIWEKQRRKRYRPLKMKYSLALEDGFQHYLSDIAVAGRNKVDGHRVLDNKLEVDFSQNPMKLLKPHKTLIRRSFHYGFWVRYRVSAHQTQLHLRVHRLQLDNQLPGAIFPIVLAPILPPKTVAVESAPKPFTELSVLIRKTDYSSVLQFKYCRLLVQEFSVKIDQGFLGAMLGLFSSGEVTDNQLHSAFLRDCEMVNQSLMEDTIQSTTYGIRNFYDELHCSPIKVHLSFSMYGGDDSGDKKPQIQWHVLNLFLQSVGIVLTDIQDVIFKLGYFERKHTFYTQAQLTSEIARHYSQQAIKQMYVLVLGLDVLGNPFGVIRGLAEGIEDLFYEPYQGAIQGPEEFAEGLAIGVKSMLGHAVGGAAGAVSRITGALGKGIATLTMDEEYQKKRREAINKRPADMKEGFARGGHGLVMGVFHGVTGIVTKPVEGARQEGVGGFFKGVGKGLIGVFTRPASGVVDFASNSFDGIRRLAELSDEVQRLRPARYFQPDGIVRSYVYREAEGNQILQDAGKGRFACEHYIGHLSSMADGRAVLMVTDKRIIFISKGDVFGHWDCDWDYSWDQLKEAPILTPKGIQILLKEKQKKLIGSSTLGKMISVLDKDRKYAELLVSKMRITLNAVMCK